MKRLLLVSYGFPPVSRVQSQGAAKLARGLAQRGWEVHVLTVADPPTFLNDGSLLTEMPENVIVHTTYSAEPTRLIQLYRRALGKLAAGDPSSDVESDRKRSYTSMPPWAVKTLRSLFFPDEKVGWTPWAVREGLRLHRAEPFSAIISTGPPYTAHGIARRLARKTGVAWLAVLMDPIVGCYAFPPATPLHAWLSRRYEARVARDAKAVATATQPWAEALIGRNPECRGRVLVYPNGFDPADYEAPAPPEHEGLLVSYVGSFQLSIRPNAFLDAVVALRSSPEIAHDLRVRFVGPIDEQTSIAIAEKGLTSVVERPGPVGHREAVQQMRAADVLLFILGPEPESAGILTGKLPEYLASGAAVLAQAPKGVATDAITRAEAGWVVPPDDPAATESALREIHSLWRERRLPRPQATAVAEFNRDRALDRLAEALDSIVQRSDEKGAGA
jgi:glycosyltransferase involved in cell wall biosynthesis